MRPEDVHTLLDRIDALRHPCDLDLLMFFVKHPHTLLASEQLAAFMGYDIEQLAQSLDVLLEAGLVTRSQNPTQAARMHVFAAGGTPGGWLPALVTLASTRAGRLALIRVLKSRSPARRAGPAARVGSSPPAAPSRRPFLLRPKLDVIPTSEPLVRRRGGDDA
jgi:hypothetical protein